MASGFFRTGFVTLQMASGFFRTGFVMLQMASGFFRIGFVMLQMASGFFRIGFVVLQMASGFFRIGFVLPTLTIQKSEKKGIDFQREIFFVNAYYSVILMLPTIFSPPYYDTAIS